jgi:hypothetical protein
MLKKGKICIFKSYYMLIYLYGAETWKWANVDIGILMAADM